ncbi:DNA cytosine methyltransferase [Sphingobacterium lactis]|uniref:DNA cytosine methyltransferase n=1 Tax=Sphingobacterium lactis TaxID=797291 RepID=UPI003EC78DD7
MVKNPEAVRYIVVDLFCGAGGTTTGFANANDESGNPIAIVAACVNHDHKAIRSHWENHPEVYHFEEDIRILELSPLVEIVKTYRKLYPNAKVVLWASLECTNFSKAKGGQSRDADSRTLADHLDRYVIAINPDYVQIENVVEFMSWGPLNENGKPLSMKSGIDWMRWREHIKSFGYRDDWRELNSADFGAYTSRNRLFGCFAKKGLPIVWPEPTHSKKGSNKTNLFGNDLKKWNAVKDLLDFEDEGESIFNRKKPLVENSLKRIYAGLIKEVAGGKSAFLAQYNSGKDRITSIEKPCNTIPTENRFGLVQTAFLVKNYSGNPYDKISSINNPSPTLTTIPHESLVSVNPFVITSSYKGVSKSVDEPVSTILASRKHHYLVNPCFLTKYYGNEKGCESINDPLDTIPTKDRFSLVQAHWLDKQYSGEHNHQSINQPAGTILTSDKHALMTAKGFIYNPSHGGHAMHIEQPCPTIIARQDKAPLYFIQYSIDTSVRIEIYKDDSETMVKIKEFMAMYGISDIRMRMLKVSELKLIQGFPKDYKLYGNQSDQKKFIGNSVVPHVVQAWAECQGEELLKMVA